MNILRKYLAVIAIWALLLSSMPITSNATAYDPLNKVEGKYTLDLRFWNDEKPDVGFYINAGNRYLLESVTAPGFGTSAGDWSAMDLLRGMYTGADYLNYIPEGYFEGYIERVNNYINSKAGDLDKNKSTEWSRVTLGMSASGVSILSMGKPGKYVLMSTTMTDRKGELVYNGASNAVVSVKFEDDGKMVIKEPLAFNYKGYYDYQIIMPGTYYIVEQNGEKKIVDENKQPIVNADGIEVNPIASKYVSVDGTYDFVEKLSKSYKFSYRQGINGPIWILIALETGGYEFYTEEELNQRGVTVTANDINTKGKLIDYILDKEITNNAGRLGGWALSGKSADPDITMMAVQGLAPYYVDENKFNKAGSTRTYKEFKAAVERAVAAMAEDQGPSGGFTSWGTGNSESISQVVVGLTALGIDPLSDAVYLPTIDRTVSFIKAGGTYDGVWTNNMIDALISFWAMGSGSSSEVSGFKHVTTGYDGGGGSGTGVNGMATDQAIYGLIAYDRFKKGENRLYDMTDMINGEYKTLKAKTYQLSFKQPTGEVITTKTYSPYEVLEITDGQELPGKRFVGWNTKEDGTGASYVSGEKLSMPDHETTLYAQYENTHYQISYELNGAVFNNLDINNLYTVEDLVELPKGEQMTYPNHSFIGWFELADMTGELVENIDKGSIGDRTLYAKWENDVEKAKVVDEAISLLPSVENLQLNNIAALTQVKEQYNALNENQKHFVKNYDYLLQLEAQIEVLKIQLENQQIAKTVVDLIAELPAEENLTTLDKANIEKARKNYEQLTSAQQGYILNYEKLLQLESKLVILLIEEENANQAQPVAELIKQLPEVAEVTIEDEEQVRIVREKYEQLTVKQKSYVTNYETVAQLEAQIEKLKEIIVEQSKQKAEQVIAEINALPTIEQLAIEHDAQLTIIRKQYDALFAQEKVLVTNYEKLLQLEVKMLDITNQQIADETVANEVSAALNELASLEQVDLNQEEHVIKVRAMYEQLTAQQKQYVKGLEKLQVLEQEIESLKQLAHDLQKANQVDKKMKQLIEVAQKTKEELVTIQSVLAQYEQLNASQKVYVQSYAAFIALQAEIVQLIEQQELEALHAQQMLQLIGQLDGDVSLSPTSEDANVYGPATGQLIITGDMTIATTIKTTIELRNIVVKGQLTIQAPNATVVVEKHSKVEKETLVLDVAANTFINKGNLQDVIVSDADETRIINEQSIERLIVKGNGPNEIVGNFKQVILEASNLKITGVSKIDQLQVNTNAELIVKGELKLSELIAEANVVIEGNTDITKVLGEKQFEAVLNGELIKPIVEEKGEEETKNPDSTTGTEEKPGNTVDEKEEETKNPDSTPGTEEKPGNTVDEKEEETKNPDSTTGTEEKSANTVDEKEEEETKNPDSTTGTEEKPGNTVDEKEEETKNPDSTTDIEEEPGNVTDDSSEVVEKEDVKTDQTANAEQLNNQSQVNPAKKLPNTATNTHNLLLVGVMSLLASLLLLRNRKKLIK